MLTQHVRISGQYREGLSDASQVVRGADDGDRRSNSDPLLRGARSPKGAVPKLATESGSIG